MGERGRHLLGLINDILDVSRVEAGKIELARQPLPLDEAVEASLALARPQADKAGVVLASEIPSDLTPVLADPVRLRQILFNLLSNGIKFTPTGGTITLRAFQKAEGTKQKAEGGEQRPEGSRQKAEDSETIEPPRLPAAGCILPSGEKLPSAGCLLPSVVIEVEDTGQGIPPE